MSRTNYVADLAPDDVDGVRFHRDREDSLNKLVMATRLIRDADDTASRLALFRYFTSAALGRLVRVELHTSDREVTFRLSGARWRIRRASAQLGGIHDVWIDNEYGAFDGFRVRSGGVVLDIGANVGAYTIWQATKGGPNGRVVSVEAAPSTVAVLRGNIALNALEDRVSVVEAAAWSSGGTVEFDADPRRSSTNSIAHGRPTADPAAERRQVAAVTLHDLVCRDEFGSTDIDVCKIDVEGAELEILRGASRQDLRRIRRFVIEVDGQTEADVRTRMADVGFAFVGRRKNVVYFGRT